MITFKIVSTLQVLLVYFLVFSVSGYADGNSVNSTTNSGFESDKSEVGNVSPALAYKSAYLQDEGNDTTISPNTTTTTTETPTTTPQPCINIALRNVTEQGVTATEATFSVTLQGFSDTCSTSLIVNCSTANDWSWITPIILNPWNLTTEQTNITIEGLAEYTNYSCSFELSEQDQSISINVTFQTEEVAPSEPEYLEVHNVTATSFNLTWSAPTKIPTNLLGYNLTIARLNVSSANHYWSGCSGDPNETIVVYLDAINQNVNYTFEDALADFNYSIEIAAWSTAGLGNSTTSEVSTKIAASEPPQNVQFNVSELASAKNIKQSLLVSWNMPCNTHGPVNRFVLEINGVYKYDQNIIDQRSFTTNDVDLNYNIEDLIAASDYQIGLFAVDDSNETIEGIPFSGTFSTSENFPSAVEYLTSFTTDSYLHLTWDEPTNNPGNITNYVVILNYIELNWNKTSLCSIDPSLIYNWQENVTDRTFMTTDLVPSAVYNVSIYAVTSRGSGNTSDLQVTSYLTDPELFNVTSAIQVITVDENTYDVETNISISAGCFNGPFLHYSVTLNGTRANYPAISIHSLISNHLDNAFSFKLEPEYLYQLVVTVVNAQFGAQGDIIEFISPAGVPSINESSISSISVNATTTVASLSLRKDQFGNAAGNVTYLAIIISSENVTGGSSSAWDGSEWPVPDPSDLEGTSVYYQATPINWWPFEANDTVDYVIGQNASCSDEDKVCNRPLEPGTTYYVLIRVFTRNYYRNSMPVKIVTDPISRLALILGLSIGLTFLAVVGFVGFFVWKRKVLNFVYKGTILQGRNRQTGAAYNPIDSEFIINLLNKEGSGVKTEIPRDKFVEYCEFLKNHPEALKEQWEELAVKTEEVCAGLEISFALQPENRRKNRFKNISPYNHTRVKLQEIDEDDEMWSDYVNASYIKGFSKKNEYIATQGPKDNTARDFWKMVYQENVTMIVMVARFIENGQEKCHRYFPKNQESMIFGHDIEVKCSMELNFDIYYVRTLQVRNNDHQLTVTHMQFMDWPDFGIPKGQENIVTFCHQMRKRWVNDGGMAVMHCSAGVGRTGTIIAIDILSQALEVGKKIDVFNTVLELRQQRMSMVQTKEQYLYIHQVLAHIILNGYGEDDDNDSEHLYQNVGLDTDKVTVETAF